jgi:hypothetical protein
MNANQEPLDQYYGFLPTAKTLEQKRTLGTRAEGDQGFVDGAWLPLDPTPAATTYSAFGCPIRRPIDVNGDQPKGREPYELAPKDAADVYAVEITSDGLKWHRVWASINMSEYLSLNPEILAVRRRKQVAEPQYVCPQSVLDAAKGPVFTPSNPMKEPTAPIYTPAELDAAAKDLFPEISKPLFCSKNREACRRHIAKVKELQTLADQYKADYYEAVENGKQLAAQIPRWHRVRDGKLPGKGEPFDAYNENEHSGGHLPFGSVGVEELFKSMGYTHWHPLSPLPKQKSEAERLYGEFSKQPQFDSNPDNIMIKFAEFILERKDKQ